MLSAAATREDLVSVDLEVVSRRACDFVPWDEVWIYRSSRSPEIVSPWRGPGELLEQQVVLHR